MALGLVEAGRGAADRQTDGRGPSPSGSSGSRLRPAHGFPLGGSGRLWGAELVKVESQEDMAVLALDRAPPTDWPGHGGGERDKRKNAADADG